MGNYNRFIVGKYAYKNKGFMSGIIGKIEVKYGDTFTKSKYVLVYKDGTTCIFNKLDEITIVDDQIL